MWGFYRNFFNNCRFWSEFWRYFRSELRCNLGRRLNFLFFNRWKASWCVFDWYGLLFIWNNPRCPGHWYYLDMIHSLWFLPFGEPKAWSICSFDDGSLSQSTSISVSASSASKISFQNMVYFASVTVSIDKNCTKMVKRGCYGHRSTVLLRLYYDHINAAHVSR